MQIRNTMEIHNQWNIYTDVTAYKALEPGESKFKNMQWSGYFSPKTTIINKNCD